jgi:hypothetical protein
MVQITYIDADGGSRTVAGEVGSTVMETAIRNDVPGIEAGVRRRLRLRHLPRLCRRGLEGGDRRARADGGGHARFRRRCAPDLAAVLPDPRQARTRRVWWCATPARQG